MNNIEVQDKFSEIVLFMVIGLLYEIGLALLPIPFDYTPHF